MSELKGACIFGQSGGPTSVINASAYGVIATALKNPNITRVLGAEHGIKGVLNDRLFDMGQEDPAELELLKYTPSSALGSCRYKMADPDVDDTDYKRILEIFKKYDVRYFFYDGGNDPYGYTEEVFFPVHPQKSIAVSDRSSMLNIIRHSECYNLGSGWLLEGYSESDLITRPLSLPADTTMQVGWITKRGYMLDAECEQFLKFCQEALDDCCTGSL